MSNQQIPTVNVMGYPIHCCNAPPQKEVQKHLRKRAILDGLRTAPAYHRSMPRDRARGKPYTPSGIPHRLLRLSFRNSFLRLNLTLVVQFLCPCLNHIPDFTVLDVCVQVFFYPLRFQFMLVSGHKCSMNTAGRIFRCNENPRYSACLRRLKSLPLGLD